MTRRPPICRPDPSGIADSESRERVEPSICRSRGKRVALNLSFGSKRSPQSVVRGCRLASGSLYRAVAALNLSSGRPSPQSVVRGSSGPPSVVREPSIRRPGAPNPSSESLNPSSEVPNVSFRFLPTRWAATRSPDPQSLSKLFKPQTFKGDGFDSEGREGWALGRRKDQRPRGAIGCQGSHRLM